MSDYANPVLEKIDPDHLFSVRLYRENCSFISGSFVKDLSKLNRQLKDIIIIDVNTTYQYMNRIQLIPLSYNH